MPQVNGTIRENDACDYAPIAMLQVALRRWWLVSLLTILGAGAGWLFYRIQPPVYEANASILTNVDFSSTGMLTQFEEDAMMDAVGGVLQSNEVIQQVLAKAGRQNIPLDIATFKKTTFIERRLGTWELRVRSTSPRTAQQIANIWMQEGYAVLKDAYQHATAARVTQDHLSALEACLQHAAVSEADSTFCSGAKLPDIQAELKQSSATLANDQLASRGIIVGALLGQPQEAALPGQPVVGGRGTYLFAGAVIGFLVGFVIGQSGLRFRG